VLPQSAGLGEMARGFFGFPLSAEDFAKQFVRAGIAGPEPKGDAQPADGRVELSLSQQSFRGANLFVCEIL